MKIISLYGPQGAGKSEAAKALASLPGWHRLSFAGPIYAMMSALFGMDARTLDKASTHDGLCGKTLRHALATLGTDWGRDMIGERIWTDAMNREILRHKDSGSAGVVIDDLRFTNEYHTMRGWGATILHIERDVVWESTHASERDWVNFIPTLTINNNGSVLDLKNRIKELVS